MGQEQKPDTSRRQPFAKKSLGQNFLTDPNIVGRIVSALGLSEGDLVVEIGPGRGALTGRLLETGAALTAIEIDRHLAQLLRDEYGDRDSFRLVEADFLETDLAEVASCDQGRRLKIVANLPYYVSTPILRKLFGQRELVSEMVVMLQKEVAERITAAPGDSQRGFLTVVLERGFDSEILFPVSKGAFRPVPKVESAVVRLKTRQTVSTGSISDDVFTDLAGAAFSQKRKTLKNNLQGAQGTVRSAVEAAGGPESVLEKAGIDLRARAEALTRDEWGRLAEAIFTN